MIDEILISFKTSDGNIKNYSMLSLAFLGDSIHSLFVRNMLISRANNKVKELHSKTTSYVKAKSQSNVLEKIFLTLSNEEQQIVKTARNSKTNNIAKNSSIKEYKNATAFEALLGYLALKQNFTRLNEILNLSVQIVDDIN